MSTKARLTQPTRRWPPDTPPPVSRCQKPLCESTRGGSRSSRPATSRRCVSGRRRWGSTPVAQRPPGEGGGGWSHWSNGSQLYIESFQSPLAFNPHVADLFPGRGGADQKPQPCGRTRTSAPKHLRSKSGGRLLGQLQ